MLPVRVGWLVHAHSREHQTGSAGAAGAACFRVAHVASAFPIWHLLGGSLLYLSVRIFLIATLSSITRTPLSVHLSPATSLFAASERRIRKSELGQRRCSVAVVLAVVVAVVFRRESKWLRRRKNSCIRSNIWPRSRRRRRISRRRRRRWPCSDCSPWRRRPASGRSEWRCRLKVCSRPSPSRAILIDHVVRPTVCGAGRAATACDHCLRSLPPIRPRHSFAKARRPPRVVLIALMVMFCERETRVHLPLTKISGSFSRPPRFCHFGSRRMASSGSIFAPAHPYSPDYS